MSTAKSTLTPQPFGHDSSSGIVTVPFAAISCVMVGAKVMGKLGFSVAPVLKSSRPLRMFASISMVASIYGSTTIAACSLMLTLDVELGAELGGDGQGGVALEVRTNTELQRRAPVR